MTKQPKTIQEMMTLLVEERGLDITGFSDSSTVLLDCNYYRLSGYFRAFQIDPSHGNNRFRNGTHIRDFMIPYLMDEQLRLLILRGTSSLEQTLRAHFAYYLAQNGGAYSYTELSSYKTIKYSDGTEAREVLIENIHKWLERSSEVCIRHYRKNNEPIPIWAAVEAMPFDTLSKMISLHTNTTAVDELNQSLSLGKNRQRAAQIIHSMVYLRNICSHHCRLWNREIVLPPPVLDATAERYGSYAYEDRSVWKSLIVLMDLIDGIKKNSTYSSMLIKQAESNDNYFWGLCHPKRWH